MIAEFESLIQMDNPGKKLADKFKEADDGND